jgi:hypothetical protein
MYSRRAKESHRDTVSYEIDMLSFCAERLKALNGTGNDGESALALEGFLLHYRNLIRFFSGKNHRRPDDISTANSMVWAGRKLRPEEKVSIKDAATELDDDFHTAISQYLQHCTTLRHSQDRSWDVDGMLRRLTPIIAAFELAFPR